MTLFSLRSVVRVCVGGIISSPIVESSRALLLQKAASTYASCAFKARQPQHGVFTINHQKKVVCILNYGAEMSLLVWGLVLFLTADK